MAHKLSWFSTDHVGVLLPKIKNIPKNTNGRLAIPAPAGLLVKIVKCNMPVQADDILLPADPRTRHHHSFNFKHIQSHTTQYKHSFFVRTVPEWNCLPEACVNVDTITAFQMQLHYAH